MKKILLIICLSLMCTSCIVMQKKQDTTKIVYENAFLINAFHIQLIKKYFPEDKNQIIRIFRNEKIVMTSSSSPYDYSKYDVIVYQKEYSYTFRLVYEIEIKEDVIISCKQKDSILLGIEESGLD